MKKTIKYFVIALTTLVMIAALTACGSTPADTSATTPKDELKDYINNNFVKTFGPENNAIVDAYGVAADSGDNNTIAKALAETLTPKNDALLEKLKAFKPKTTEVQELHNILTQAVELRKDAYAQLLGIVTNKNVTDAAVDAAFNKLGESDDKFMEFNTKGDSLKKELGLVDGK